MIPSVARRLVALTGIAAGALAAYLADWPLAAIPSVVWKLLATLAALALLGIRAMPSLTVSDRELRSRVGDRAVNRLVRIQNAGLASLFFAILPIVLVAPFIGDLGARHTALEFGAVAFACTLAAFAFVEWRFRELVGEAGLRFTPQ